MPIPFRALPLIVTLLLGAPVCATGAGAATGAPATGGGATGAVAPPAAPTVTPAQRVADKQKEVTADLQRVKAAVEAAGEQKVADPLQREIDLLGRIELVLTQQATAVQTGDEQRAALEALKLQIRDFPATGIVETPPYSLLLLDATRDELRGLRERGESIESTVAAAQQALDQAKATASEKDTARRRAREAHDAAAGQPAQVQLGLAMRQAQLESRLATEQQELRHFELENQKAARDVFQARLELLTMRETTLAQDTVFTADDLRSKLVEIESREKQLRERLAEQELRAGFYETQWAAARRRLDESSGGDDVLTQEVEARRMAHQARQREMVVLTKRLERLALLRELWNRRYLVWRDAAPRQTLAEWQAHATTSLDGFATESRLLDLELRDVRQTLAGLQGKIEALPADAPALPWLREQMRAGEELATIVLANSASLEAARRLADRLITDIRGEITRVSLGERMSDLWNGVKSAWGFEITSVEDRPITVGKIISGVLLLLIGFFLSKVISSWLGRRFLPRLRFNEGAAAAVRTVVFYVLLLSFLFLALRIVNVPLTAFTILGGAVAIGVGFGSQNIVNNFMSGLIMLAERPIRVGDLIQIGELYGIVQHIGARSTRVLTGTNVEIIVPNSSFLESNVINWTLSETRVRISVTVGVVYGSPTREVGRLLRKAVDEHGRVLKNPQPIVLFTDFGDNALMFEVHFWVKMRTMMDCRTIESDVRFRIDSLFNEAGLVIAFPQRDVHLDSVKPIEVKMIAAEAEAPASS